MPDRVGKRLFRHSPACPTRYRQLAPSSNWTGHHVRQMDWAPWLKALHIMAFAAWMAGMWYLPRLLVYHSDAEPGSASSETFKVMERRLLRAIATPALLVTLVAGVLLATVNGQWTDGWLH